MKFPPFLSCAQHTPVILVRYTRRTSGRWERAHGNSPGVPQEGGKFPGRTSGRRKFSCRPSAPPGSPPSPGATKEGEKFLGRTSRRGEQTFPPFLTYVWCNSEVRLVYLKDAGRTSGTPLHTKPLNTSIHDLTKRD